MDDQFDWNKNFEEWSKGKKEASEIVKIMQSIHLLMDGCTANLTNDQLNVIKKQMDATIKQCVFWKKQNNRKRFIYDLREFGIWLADFITEAEEKFWENENNP